MATLQRSLFALSLLALSLFAALSITGCRSDGPTTRIDYTCQKPVWTDASARQIAPPIKPL